MFERVTLEALRRPGRTADDARAYKEVVENLKGDLDNDELAAEEAPERLRREAPELAKLADVLPKNRAELYAALGLIIFAITLYLNIDQEKKPLRTVFDPSPETLSRREMRLRKRQADAVREWGHGQLVRLRFERGGSVKTEEWSALHSPLPEYPDAAYRLARERTRRGFL